MIPISVRLGNLQSSPWYFNNRIRSATLYVQDNTRMRFVVKDHTEHAGKKCTASKSAESLAFRSTAKACKNLPIIAWCSLYEHFANLSVQDKNHTLLYLCESLPVRCPREMAYAHTGHPAPHFDEDLAHKLQLTGWPQLWQHMIVVVVLVLTLWHQEHHKLSSLLQFRLLLHTRSNCPNPCPEASSSRARENDRLQENHCLEMKGPLQTQWVCLEGLP